MSLGELFNLFDTQYFYWSNRGRVGSEEQKTISGVPLSLNQSDTLPGIDKITPVTASHQREIQKIFLQKRLGVTSSVYFRGYFLNRPVSFPGYSLDILNCPPPLFLRSTPKCFKT